MASEDSKEGAPEIEDGQCILLLKSHFTFHRAKMLTANVEILRIQAARDTGALKEAKDKLEKRVEELTWRLDIEKHLRVLTCTLSITVKTKQITASSIENDLASNLLHVTTTSVVSMAKFYMHVCQSKWATDLSYWLQRIQAITN